MAQYGSMSKRWDFGTFQREMSDPDPDKPHQALFDINQDLEKQSFVLDESVQRAVFSSIMQQALNSSHSDVQGAAVKCIPNLVKKVKENSILEEVKNLADRMGASKKEQRDIAAISLKYLVDNIPFSFRNCVKVIVMSLVNQLPNAADDVKLDMIDVTTDLIKRFGGVLSIHTAKALNEDGIQAAVLAALGAKSLSVQKKAIACVAACSVHSSEVLFQQVMTEVINGISQQRHDKVRRYIQLCSAVSRVAGERVGGFLPQIMPLLMDNLDEAKLEDIGEDHDRIEVRENILQAYEAFVTKCPHQITPFLDHILESCLEGMSHDPYYDYGCEEEGDVDMEDVEDDEYADMLEQDCDDDDDTSWKVRKTSAKCLSAIIVSRPDCLHRVYDSVCSKEARGRDVAEENPSNRLCLPERFKEREESVRLDIFRVFGELLAATSKKNAPTPSTKVSDSFSNSRRLRTETRPEVRYLLDLKEFIVESIVKASRDKSMKVKTVCFQHLTTFAALLGQELVPMTGQFLAIIKETLALKEATSALKTEVLQFLHLIVISSVPMSPEAETIPSEVLPLVLQCVGDRYYKIVVESLKVCGALAPLIASSKQPAGHSTQVFTTVYDRLSVTDVDQEVKDAVIATMGSVLRHFASGDAQLLPAASVSQAFQQLLVMFKYECSRIPVMKALSATRDVPMDVGLVEKFMSEMCGFLRMSSRPLLQASLHGMKVLVERKAGQTPEPLLTHILKELVPLLSDGDLHLAHLAIDLADAILRCLKTVPDVLEKSVLPKFIDLLKSPLLQGSALESLERVFGELGQRSVMGYHPLLRMVLGAVGQCSSVSEQRQVLASVAAVTAKLTAQATEDQQAKTVEEYVSCLTQDSETSCALGLACLGEIGKCVDLTTNPRVMQVVREKFYHPKEDIKLLTSSALGKIAYGNPADLLPDLLSSIEKNDNNHDVRYLLLRALKETLSQANPHNDYDPLKPHLAAVYNVGAEFAGHEDEGTRTVVAECLGKLAVLSPATTVKGLILAAEKAGATGEATATAITAMKYAVSEPDFEKTTSLEDNLQFFLGFMKKPEGVDKEGLLANVKVRRASVQLFTAAVHSKPELIRPHLQTYMKNLLGQCDVDNDLVTPVNLGPFVHKVDDGIEIRKSAFECIDILLDGHFSDGDPLLDYLNDYPTVAEQVSNGMKQTQGQDIQILSFMMFCKLIKIPRAASAVTNCLDKIFAPALLGKVQERNVKEVSKDNISKQDAERIGDLLYNMLKMVFLIKASVPTAEENPNFAKFLTTVHLVPEHIVRAAEGGQ
eukprot:TRINITY_DN22312_c0_g1_i1.p1 TRINITY_DN22312_c0_g1~~TRINITY_DN22312_c0_g1_i1.p1  ORF type:complete len:1293 (+),score=608.41 TRINITY_DN22312_c0_g1_i1:46-3924(+)